MNKELPSKVDIIIAGGGAAGCLLASRVATAHPSLSILVVEAGPDNRDVSSITTPALFRLNMAPNSGFMKYYMSNTSEELGGRPMPVLAPRVLGGGGSVNIMTYARGMEEDFKGWLWPKEEMVGFLKKFETYTPDAGPVDSAAHGTTGEFIVGHGGGFTGYKMWSDDFLQAAEKAGLPVVPDSQNMRVSNGVSPVASWVDPRTGYRQDTAHVLLHPILDSGKTKLQVLTDHSVVRVVFDNDKRCSGVEISSNSGTLITIGARKQVVLCAGTINSPQILERSGIGNRSLLSSLNIPVVSDLPGVGTNYQDHHFISSKYKSSAPSSATLDGLWGGTVLPDSPEIQESGMLGWNSGVLAGKIRPSAAELARMSPRFQEIYARDFKALNKPLALVYGHVGAIGPPMPPPGQYISFAIAVAYGYSRGQVHIKGPNVNDGPDFDTGTLSDVDHADVEVLVWAYKRCREIIRRMKFAEGGWPPSHPNFNETSEAAVQRDEVLLKESGDRTSNGDIVLEDIAYNEDDDKAIEQFVKDNAGTLWHYAGTCAMKSLQNGGVVDENLSVYGVDSLKVADLSILPSLVAGNTYSTAIMVGEKAAAILSKELDTSH